MSAPALPHLTQPCAVHATHTQEGRRGQRLDRRCRRDANHEVPRRAPPLGPAERFARSLDENCNRSLNTFSKKASSTRRWMPCPWPREVASTDAEHTNLTAPEHVSTNAPGRIERSREHSNLAVTRHAPRAPAPAPRATRPSVRPVAARAMFARLTRTKADAVSPSTTAAVATRTTRSSPRTCRTLRVDVEEEPRPNDAGCHAPRPTPAPRASSPAYPGWGRSSIIRNRAHVNRRPAALCFRGVTRAGVTP